MPDGIVITPPDDFSDNTDCDSGDEDTNNPDHLNHNQLSAQAEYYFDNNYEVDCSTKTAPYEWDDEDDFPLSMYVQSKPTKVTWKNGDLHANILEKFTALAPPITLSADSSPLQFFELMLSPNIVTDLVKFSNMYALKNNKQNLGVSTNEVYVFIGILLLSGYVPLPRRRMYWEESEDVHNKLVSQAMRRNKFEEISSIFHAADNDNLPEGDKIGKIRPLIDSVKKNS